MEKKYTIVKTVQDDGSEKAEIAYDTEDKETKKK
jgi:hypothetical protein